MQAEPEKHLYELIKDFHQAMLVTHSGSGMHARPMNVAELRHDADAYFATSIDSPKVDEIEANPEVLLTFQGRHEFASIQGTASIVRERALIEQLWSETWRVWFPGGKDDPQLCILKFSAKRGEYWDNSGTEGIRYAVEGIKAVLQGRQPEIDETVNAKVALGQR